MSFQLETVAAELTIDKLQHNLQQALTGWQHADDVQSPLHELRIFRVALHQQQGNIQEATKQVILHTIKALALTHPEHAAVLQSRFMGNEKVEQAAKQLNLSAASFHRKRGEGLLLLAETLLSMELTERATYRTRLTARLPPSLDTKLIGKTEQLQALEALLQKAEAPWVMVIAGIGGIGKTTLADALVRRMIEHCTFDEIGWITARTLSFDPGSTLPPMFAQPTLTAQTLVEALTLQLMGSAFTGQRTSEEALVALVQRLKTTPHLIVIDNLETVRDVTTLLPTLRRLVNPSKILLTTRHSLTDEADLYHSVVPELAPSDALALIRQEAKLRNLPHVLTASDADLYPIYATVGGNALALRLVAGQLRVHPLGTVLADLLGAQGKVAETLYTFIYWQTWALLDESARTLLVAMPLISEAGGNLELLAATCNLPTIALRTALEQLVMFNLVDVRGDLHERRYTIHSLTRTFLHEQVIRWQQPADWELAHDVEH